ncbi:diaminopimelate epimerase [Propionispira arboris]|uniref:Diaminopimelate epimerase n=1 Tax=Propionispira arboris TaxID=84035 RepID=A0A1H7AFI5_9FIRM|nr:diaminopimelate epimerase [Propionispira arboris]SEJ59755.1 diaminopimelate epimerase [Propionispira arboris]
MNFTKMHGLGNDFIILNQLADTQQDYVKLAQILCDRNTGIGGDGILLILPSTIADIKMRILNIDGSEAEMCGNGIRCFAKYLYEHDILKKTTFSVETKAGIIKPSLQIADQRVKQITIDMGQPILERDQIPMIGPKGQVIDEILDVAGQEYKITSVLMGVPHTMLFVEDITAIDPSVLGPKLEKHHKFPQNTNVNFVQVIDKHTIKVKTWERGAGATLACGTGCCASVVASYLNDFTEDTVDVQVKLGTLHIEYRPNESVMMTGSAIEVFSGIYDIK